MAILVHFLRELRKIETNLVNFEGRISEMTLPVKAFDLSKRDVIKQKKMSLVSGMASIESKFVETVFGFIR